MKKFIKGTYRRNIFESDKGYVIGIFRVRETNDEELEDFVDKTITFTGYFADLKLDDTYIFYGESVEHPKYGFQYQVSEYERVKPEDKDGIIEFLSSNLFKGVGEKLAKSIVETLGDNTLDRILTEEDCLLLVPKMTSKKAKSIVDTLSKYEESHQTIVYLSELGFAMKDALSIYNKYRMNTISNIENDIYRVIDDVDEITFLKIEGLRDKLNIEDNDERRIKACILYIMQALTYHNGDTYLTYETIHTEVSRYLKYDVDEITFDSMLEELKLFKKIKIQREKYYLYDIYKAEKEIVNKIDTLEKLPHSNYKNLERYIEQLEKINDISYNDKQREAIIKALTNNVVIITGGPGTGKTTIIKAITEIYKQANKLSDKELEERIALLAPTGRASKRMTEATLLPATTIHRFLKWNKDTNKFAVNKYNKDNSHLIIIDEVSMIDTNLLGSLFEGLTDNIKLVLVGDYNQLPSVGPGQVLKDLIESDMVLTIELDLLYRQRDNSYINILASEIKDGEINEYFKETKDDYTFLECDSTMIVPSLKKMCMQIIKHGYDYKKFQIMAPMYRGTNGIDNLNKQLQEVFNPRSIDKEEIKYGDVYYRENDKVLQLVNMPDDNVFNGDIGVIDRIVKANISKSGKNEIYIDFDGNIVKYETKDLIKIKHGYVITIHKSQGSEFDVVVMPITHEYYRMLYRKLVYTGVTRAKKKLIIIGEGDSFIRAVMNNNEYVRKTDLKNKLIEKITS